MLTSKDGTMAWNNASLAWTIVCGVVALAYDALVTYAQGGSAYEMLVSGNMKRRSAQAMGGSMKISSHKVEKEFRYWKGFVSPWFIVLLVAVVGIVFGANQAEIDRILASTNDKESMTFGLGIAVLILLMLAGWSVLPFLYINLGGVYVSYYWSILLGILPIVIGGVFYIVGAYAARNKAVRKQEEADRASKAVLEKPKKINYGGLPGTKPKKKK